MNPPVAKLSDLPPPPIGRTGWPWTVEPGHIEVPDTLALPRITIVTPSFMQGQFLEETIRSVLLQGYPSLEYIVMDGGSTDGSVEILEKYGCWLSYWISQKDSGHARAINAGFRRATGSILAWINSDDFYHPGALHAVARKFISSPSTQWLAGGVDDCYSRDSVIKRIEAKAASVSQCIGRRNPGFHQPGMFWSRQLVDRVGPLDPSIPYCFDHDFWVRSLLLGYELDPIDVPVAYFRRHRDSKTCSQLHLFAEDDWTVYRRHSSRLESTERRDARRWLSEHSAGICLNSVYGALWNGRRGEALKHLLKGIRYAPGMHPPRLFFGALYRVLVTGRAAAWFTREDFQ